MKVFAVLLILTIQRGVIGIGVYANQPQRRLSGHCVYHRYNHRDTFGRESQASRAEGLTASRYLCYTGHNIVSKGDADRYWER